MTSSRHNSHSDASPRPMVFSHVEAGRRTGRSGPATTATRVPMPIFSPPGR